MPNRSFTAFFLFSALLTARLDAQCPKLIWADEFVGTALDLSKWGYQIGDGCDVNLCQWGNNELQWYAQANVEVSGGTLKIVAKKETVQNRGYTSGRIRSLNKADIKYGRIEARMKMPVGQGIWPAFWMLPTENVYGIWPQSGEIDILEYLGHDPLTIFGTLHYGNLWPNNKFVTKTFTTVDGNFADGFHHYALEWSENEIRWYVDGYLYSTKTPSDLGGSRWPFDQKFHFLLNLAVGGNLPGNPNASTVFPQTFEIDYVRVYDLVGAPYLTGSQKVPFMAKNSAYSMANFPAGGSVVWSVPASATLVSGNGTKDITVNWGASGGKIAATVTNACGESKYELSVRVEPNLSTDVVLENFDQEAKIAKTFNNGVFTDNFGNPAPNAVNNSALCGKYVRSATQQYDILVYDISDVKNAADFAASEKKFYIDINTNAPVGTTILLQLENKAQALPTNYPTGRHSRYTAVTTKQNEWERLAFAFTDRPDASVSNQAVNQLILLFATNSFNGSTYHFDNFEIYAKKAAPTVDLEQDDRVKLSPNPVSSILNVGVDPDKIIEQIEVFDAAGKSLLLQKSIYNSEARIDVKSLDAGVYHLHIYLKGTARVVAKTFVRE
jgi:beta-glucanase (GH16 family)